MHTSSFGNTFSEQELFCNSLEFFLIEFSTELRESVTFVEYIF